MSKYLEQLFSLAGCVAVVNDSSTLLGSSIIQGLAQAGAITCGTGSSISDVEKSTETIFDSLSFPYLCKELYQQYSRLDILVNTLEVNIPQGNVELKKSSLKTFEQAITTKLQAINYAATEYMKISGGGSVINIIKINSCPDFTDALDYVRVKEDLLMMTKKMAVNLIKNNIRINNITLGKIQDQTKSHISLPESGSMTQESLDLIRATIFLASNCSGYMTGQDIFIFGREK